ncbi:MAG: TIGR04563 family protein [Myxococcaceae bacterium]
MSGTDNRKQSLYFPEEMLEEIQREAGRQDRSISWIVQQAWRISRVELRKMPSVNDVLPPPQPTAGTPAEALNKL